MTDEELGKLLDGVVRENPLAWGHDLMLVGMARAPGVSHTRILDALRGARVRYLEARGQGLLAERRRVTGPT